MDLSASRRIAGVRPARTKNKTRPCGGSLFIPAPRLYADAARLAAGRAVTLAAGAAA